MVWYARNNQLKLAGGNSGLRPTCIPTSTSFFIGDCQMKQIPLTQGKSATVDDADFEWLNQWKWYCNNDYATRKTLGGEKWRKKLSMHRVIIKALPHQSVDHKDGNPLNNCRSNLRFATDSQNQANRHKMRFTHSSLYRGVSWHSRKKKWIAHIGYKRKLIHLGYYKNEIDAARAYDKAAKELFGEFACLNFKSIL